MRRVCESLDLAAEITSNPLWSETISTGDGRGDYEENPLDRLAGDDNVMQVIPREERQRQLSSPIGVARTEEEARRRLIEHLTELLEYVRRLGKEIISFFTLYLGLTSSRGPFPSVAFIATASIVQSLSKTNTWASPTKLLPSSPALILFFN